MAFKFTQAVEKENAFGEQLWDVMQQLGLRRPEFSGRYFVGADGEERCQVTVMIYSREYPVSKSIHFDVVGESWKDALSHAAHQALARVCHEFSAELEATPFRYFPRRRGSYIMRPGRSTEGEDDPTVVRMASLLQALETRAGDTKFELDDARLEITFLHRKIKELSRPRSEDSEVDNSRKRKGARIKFTARKSVRPQNIVIKKVCVKEPLSESTPAADPEESEDKEEEEEEDPSPREPATPESLEAEPQEQGVEPAVEPYSFCPPGCSCKGEWFDV